MSISICKQVFDEVILYTLVEELVLSLQIFKKIKY